MPIAKHHFRTEPISGFDQNGLTGRGENRLNFLLKLNPSRPAERELACSAWREGRGADVSRVTYNEEYPGSGSNSTLLGSFVLALVPVELLLQIRLGIRDSAQRA